VPLTNFTLTNLMAEGMLLGKKLFPEELQPYPFDELQYLRRTMKELASRRAMGVDVDKEIQEALEYSGKYPSLKAELMMPAGDEAANQPSPLRKLARTLKLNRLQNRLENFNEVRRIKRGQVKAGFIASGTDFGFHDALGCAAFLSRVTSTTDN
jgi:hypothetical protein